jgi:hypothetical protein
MNKDIEINIEELVLNGFSPSDKHRIGNAVKMELSRLFAEKGCPEKFTNGVKIAEINAGEFKTSIQSNPRTTGNQIAQSIYNGLSR